MTETSTEVRIGVEVLNRPLPAGVACGGVGLSRVSTTIRLGAPLGDRVLRDTVSGSSHPPLVVEEAPAIRHVPQPFRRRATWWDESTGQVGEWWRWQRHHQAQQIDLDFGPTATAVRGEQPPADAIRTRVDSTEALMWIRPSGDTRFSTVVWTTREGRTYRLLVVDQAARPLSRAAVLDLARSVR